MVKLNLSELKDVNGGTRKVYDYYDGWDGYLILGADYHIYISPEEYMRNSYDIDTNRDQFMDDYIFMHESLLLREFSSCGAFKSMHSERGTNKKLYTDVSYDRQRNNLISY